MTKIGEVLMILKISKIWILNNQTSGFKSSNLLVFCRSVSNVGWAYLPNLPTVVLHEDNVDNQDHILLA